MKSSQSFLIYLFSLSGIYSIAQSLPEDKTRNVAILVFNGVQIIDYTAPYEILGAPPRNTYKGKAFNVYTVAEKEGPVITQNKMSINPSYTFENAPAPDIIIVPGGGGIPNHPMASRIPGAGKEALNQALLDWLKAKAVNAELIMSVCNGAFILGRAGLLSNAEVTTTGGLLGFLQSDNPSCKVIGNKRFVDNGKIITTAGFTSGIDGALHIIERYLGRGIAQKIAVINEYAWDEKSKWNRALMADKYMNFNFFYMPFPDPSIVPIPVYYSGNEVAWENRFTLDNEESATKVFSLYSDSLTNKKPNGHPQSIWISDATKNDKRIKLWKFKDDEGKEWQGKLTMETPKNKNEVEVSLRVYKKK